MKDQHEKTFNRAGHRRRHRNPFRDFRAVCDFGRGVRSWDRVRGKLHECQCRPGWSNNREFRHTVRSAVLDQPNCVHRHGWISNPSIRHAHSERFRKSVRARSPDIRKLLFRDDERNRRERPHVRRSFHQFGFNSRGSEPGRSILVHPGSPACTDGRNAVPNRRDRKSATAG